jgi:hypothetical protein
VLWMLVWCSSASSAWRATARPCRPRPRENIFALCTVLCGLNNPMCHPRPAAAAHEPCYVSSDSVQTRKINTFTHRYQEKYTRKIIPGKA